MSSNEDVVCNWSCEDTLAKLKSEKLSTKVLEICQTHDIDGTCLLALSERDFYEPPFTELRLGERKRFGIFVRKLQRRNQEAMIDLGLPDGYLFSETSANLNFVGTNFSNLNYNLRASPRIGGVGDEILRQMSDGRASRLKPEVWKAAISLGYAFLVTWVTAVVMVIVHDKVPDMKKYPPLPDLFLDNVPHIPWAFDMCEVTGSILMAIWIVVLIFHKHRFILLRRFFALAGTVFLLRCITMLITSLSVPGSHLKCAPRSYPASDGFTDWGRRILQAYDIWSGAGMSVRGVRTCGDYMFSGHTVALTLLNFFITEYTDRSLYLLHIVTWVMNMFGIFFILAAHEHYSIDVFIAFYITSRLFLYYHTLSNNQALMQGDSNRTRIWFPLLSFFESQVDGIVPNEYEGPLTSLSNLKQWVIQKYHQLGQTSVAKLAGTKLSEGAAIGEYSMVRLVDNIKKNLSIAEELRRSPRRQPLTRDKNIQADPLENELHHPTLSPIVTDASLLQDNFLLSVNTKSDKKSI